MISWPACAPDRRYPRYLLHICRSCPAGGQWSRWRSWCGCDLPAKWKLSGLALVFPPVSPPSLHHTETQRLQRAGQPPARSNHRSCWRWWRWRWWRGRWGAGGADCRAPCTPPSSCPLPLPHERLSPPRTVRANTQILQWNRNIQFFKGKELDSQSSFIWFLLVFLISINCVITSSWLSKYSNTKNGS